MIVIRERPPKDGTEKKAAVTPCWYVRRVRSYRRIGNGPTYLRNPGILGGRSYVAPLIHEPGHRGCNGDHPNCLALVRLDGIETLRERRHPMGYDDDRSVLKVRRDGVVRPRSEQVDVGQRREENP